MWLNKNRSYRVLSSALSLSLVWLSACQPPQTTPTQPKAQSPATQQQPILLTETLNPAQALNRHLKPASIQEPLTAWMDRINSKLKTQSFISDSSGFTMGSGQDVLDFQGGLNVTFTPKSGDPRKG